MSRRALAIALLVAASVAVVGGCQSYNFNPVGSCLIQPGQKQVKLGDVTTADILFVVDDSYSMDSKQQALAHSFSAFIASLATAQTDRAVKGLEPFDFHIAVTTSSVFRNYKGQGLLHTYDPVAFSVCTPGVGAPDPQQYPQGDFVAYGTNPKVLSFTKDLTWANCSAGGACSTACIAGGGTCTPSCTTTGSVTTCTDARITTLIQQFVGTCSGAGCSTGGGTFAGGNVEVGSCGSGEEQGLQGARLALQKAVAGRQPGVAASKFPHVGAKLVVVWVGDEDDCSSPEDNPIVFDTSASVPGDDSCTADRSLPLASQQAYRIGDFADYFAALVAPSGQAPSAVHPYASLGAGFIVGAVRCNEGATTVGYTPADKFLAPVCTAPSTPSVPQQCLGSLTLLGSNGAGVRFFQLADAFKGRNLDVIEGTVCDTLNPDGSPNPAGFGPALSAIADLVKAPSALRLSSLPASSEITVLRIVDAQGNTAKVCTQRTTPLGTTPPTAAEGWWFISCSDVGSPPAVSPGPTTCVYINHQAAQDPVNSCEAQPGETYSAEYMGQIPEGGCIAAGYCHGTTTSCTSSTASADCGAGVACETLACHGTTTPCTVSTATAVCGAGVACDTPLLSSSFCAGALGGPAAGWGCYAPAAGTGTCICK